ncbi:MAG TPA: prepilin peptidase [Bryobacteraceae bacterium]
MEQPDLHVPLIAAAAVMGLLIGSFLNVCIYRIPRDLSVVIPRSFCPECGGGIAWYDNMPVVSYLALRGRCRGCGCSIGLRYPIVEITTAVLFAFTVAKYGWSLAAVKWTIFEAIMIVLFWTDLEERILPDELTLGGTAAGLVLSFFVSVPGEFVAWLWPSLPPVWCSFFSAFLAACVLSVPMFLVGWGYAKVRGREGLGLGDLKLMLLLGAFLGVSDGVAALLIGSIAGSIIGLAYILIARKDASTYWLPFGSFLCLGGAVLPLVSKS